MGRSAPNSCKGSRSTVGVLRTGGPPDFRRASVRPQLRRTSLSVASKARKPAYPVYNTGAGEGWSPSIPSKSALTRVSRPGASAPACPVATHPHG